ncbi:MAG TPA: hypothetical protein VMW90_01080 [Acidobacteriota bacterium]|nr:hypothetical protein [Acidobacteriota bacterium]
MPNLLFFSRNRCTNVEQIDEKTMRSSCHLQDTFTDAYVEILVKLPDLEITEVKAEVRRCPQNVNPIEIDSLQKAVGVRIGPSMQKILKGLIGVTEDSKQLAFMVEECCHGIILCFTKDELQKAPKDKENTKEFYTNMVKENTRLYNRCAAFAAGSSLVEGIEPP